MTKAKIAGAATLLAVLTFIAYAPVFRNGFTLYDDDVYVTENPHVLHGLSAAGVAWAFTTTRAANWHPLTWISHQADASLYGPKPLGHHLTSLILHAANVVLLFLVLGAMTGAWEASGLAAALFAVHPLHVESVAWVAERKDVLSTLFWIVATGAYARYAKAPSARRMAVVALAMTAGLLAKPMLVTLPLTFLLLDFWPLERASLGWGRLVVEKTPLFALSAASSVVTVFAQRAGGALASLEATPFPQRAGNAVTSIARYLGKTVWPAGLAAFYPHPGDSLGLVPILLAAALVAALTAAAWLVRRSRPYAVVGWVWFLVTLVPVLGLVQVGKQAMADRYMYIPSIGLLVAFAWTIASLGKKGWAPAVAVVVALAAVTFVQAGVWRDSATLFEHALAVTDDNATAEVDLGAALEAKGRTAEAMTRFEAALRLDPGNRAAHNRIAGLLAREGRLDDAIAHYRQVLALRPHDAATLSNLGIALAKQHRFPEAIETLRAALAASPDDPGAVHTNLGNALLLSGRVTEAIDEYREALRLDPGDAETETNLKAALARASVEQR